MSEKEYPLVPVTVKPKCGCIIKKYKHPESGALITETDWCKVHEPKG